MTYEELKQQIAGPLYEIDRLFNDLGIKGMKLTLVARHPEEPESFLIMTEDNKKEVAALLISKAE